MSEVRKYKALGDMTPRSRIGGGEWVRLEDYDAAQVELAALREELQTSGRVRGILARQRDRALGIIKELRDGKDRDARIMGSMALDIVAVGEVLGIPGEEQEGGTGEFVEAIQDIQQRLAAAEQRNAELEKNTARYIWLRDKSESVHQFYLSTPIWFTGVKFNQEKVDSAIDASMAKPTESGASE